MADPAKPEEPAQQEPPTEVDPRMEDRRSRVVATRVSPFRQAAGASRCPGRARLAPVGPWSANVLSSATPRARRAFFWAVRSSSLVDTRAYPISSPVMVLNVPFIPQKPPPRHRAFFDRCRRAGPDSQTGSRSKAAEDPATSQTSAEDFEGIQVISGQRQG